MALVPEPTAGFIERFTAKRCSWRAIGCIAAFIACWIAWQYLPGLPHFDMPPANDRFGLLNFILSIEATLSMPILWMGMERAAERDRQAALARHKEEVAAVGEVMEAVRDLLEKLAEIDTTVDQIAEDIDNGE